MSNATIDSMIESGKQLVIVSGEGEIGTVEMYTGKHSTRAIQLRLARERCGGERWARVEVSRAN